MRSVPSRDGPGANRETHRRKTMVSRSSSGLGMLKGVLAVALAMPFAVGSLAAHAQDKEIAVMLPAAGDPYFKLKSFGYIDEGKKLGYDVKSYDAGGYGNLQKQVSQIEDVIERKVAAIVLVPASSDGTVP